MEIARFDKGEKFSDVSDLHGVMSYRWGSDIDNRYNYVIVRDGMSRLVLDKSEFVFKGRGNIIYIGDRCPFLKTTVTFYGNNSVVYFDGKSKDPVYMKLSLGYDCDFVMGGGYRISPCGPTMKIVVCERQKVLIGSQALFSNAVTIRSGDSHGLYSLENGKRINEAESVLIGDHVWVGENVSILKGSVLESGSVLGAGALWTGKRLPANSVGGGNPGKVIKDRVFWEKPGLNNRDKEYLGRAANSSRSSKFDYRDNPLPEWMENVASLDNDLPALSRLQTIDSIFC